MTSLLLTTLPSLGFRPAGALSSRLSCHVLGRGGTNAVSWVTLQQMRLASSGGDDHDHDDYKDDHYKTLGVKPWDPLDMIRKAWAKKSFETHSDHHRGKDQAQFRKVKSAGILRYPDKKAKYDVIWYGWQKAAQASATEQQRAADALRAATLTRQAARLREEAKRAKEAAEAAEAKRRDEERKAKRLADRAARRAEAEKQKQAAEENREENERRAAIRAAKAAEKKKADQEAAIKAGEAAAARKAAVEAKKAELARQREREARMVVLRHVPVQARLWDVTYALSPFRPGRILDSGVGEGTAWIEFWTAEQAKALHRVVTETGQCVILGKTIKTAAIYQGRARPPTGPDLITRSLHILMPPNFVDGEADLAELMERKLRERAFTISPVGFSSGSTHTGKWLVQDYASVAHAQSAKAALDNHYPALEVSYTEDFCGGVDRTAQEDAGAEPGSNKKESVSWLTLSPIEVAIRAVYGVMCVFMGIKEDKSSGEKRQ